MTGGGLCLDLDLTYVLAARILHHLEGILALCL